MSQGLIRDFSLGGIAVFFSVNEEITLSPQGSKIGRSDGLKPVENCNGPTEYTRYKSDRACRTPIKSKLLNKN